MGSASAEADARSDLADLEAGSNPASAARDWSVSQRTAKPVRPSGASDRTSTLATCAYAGPSWHHSTNLSTASGSPSATTSTRPSGRLRAQPETPSARAWSAQVPRYQTPWTLPLTQRCRRTILGQVSPRGKDVADAVRSRSFCRRCFGHLSLAGASPPGALCLASGRPFAARRRRRCPALLAPPSGRLPLRSRRAFAFQARFWPSSARSYAQFRDWHREAAWSAPPTHKV
jgi:hypothetical protein